MTEEKQTKEWQPSDGSPGKIATPQPDNSLKPIDLTFELPGGTTFKISNPGRKA